MADAPGNGDGKGDRKHHRSSTDAAGEVGAMFEILSMPQYIKSFAAKGITTLNSLLPAVDDPNCPEAFWLKLIPKPQDRNIVLGYLSIRRKKDPKEIAKSEQRMHTFQTVKEALSELQDLQLRKAELERGSTVLNRKESTRQEIENLLDKIDDTKQKLESAQREIGGSGGLGDSRRTTKPKISIRPASAKVPRSAAPRSPRVANEGDDGRVRAAQPQLHPSSAANMHRQPPGGGPSPPTSRDYDAETYGRERRQRQEQQQQHPFAGTCFADVSFDRRPATAAAAKSSSRGAFSTTCTVEDSNRCRLADVGPGWNRNTPVPKMRHAADRLVLPVFGGEGQTLRASSSRGSSGGRPLSATTLQGCGETAAGADSMMSSLSIQGKKATSVALGVHLENDHYAQMCCGASSRQL